MRGIAGQDSWQIANIEDYVQQINIWTRSTNSVQLRHVGARTVTYKNSFFPRTVVEWNNKPESVLEEIGASLSSQLD